MKKKFAKVFQFRITLQEIDPPIWRQIQVPESYSFYDLHLAIQNAMGWTDSHIHEFQVINPSTGQEESLGYPDEEFGDTETIPDWERGIVDYFSNDNRNCGYIYDMGDYWEHLIEFEDALPRATGVKYPVCTDGQRACPPEDCGGVPGYYDLVEALSSKNSKKKREYLEWLGRDYQIDYFDPKKVKFVNPEKRLKHMLEDM